MYDTVEWELFIWYVPVIGIASCYSNLYWLSVVVDILSYWNWHGQCFAIEPLAWMSTWIISWLWRGWWQCGKLSSNLKSALVRSFRVYKPNQPSWLGSPACACLRHCAHASMVHRLRLINLSFFHDRREICSSVAPSQPHYEVKWNEKQYQW